MKQAQRPQMELLQEQWQLTLQGELVLSCRLTWPRLNGKGRGVRAVNRYYQHMAEAWKRRWNRELYLCACLDLADKRADSRPFQPWQAQVDTCVTFDHDTLFSLWQEGTEQPGKQPAFVVRRGDAWDIKTGAPVTLASFFRGVRWRKQVMEQVTQQAEQRLRQGESLLFSDCVSLVKTHFDPTRFWVEEDGLRIFYPPELLGSRVEGTIVFPVSVPGQE